MNNKRKYLIAGLLSAFFIFGILSLRQAGNWLVVSDKPIHADALLVLMGGVEERIPQAIDLYKAGYAPLLLFPDDYEENPPLILPNGTKLSNDAAKSRHLSRQYGVPDSAIRIVQGPALNTQAEAELMAGYLEGHPETDTLILVSSSYHMRRASFIFRNEFASKGLEITLISVPSRYSTFKPDKWWRSGTSRNIVFYEYLKMAYNLLWDRW
ncbi:MAG: YdcF family protein [Lentimicrobium sp.]|jgi:uncharacterized SAM-binding protein YcdF (DUF218 family)|nr:YdcF family protein [Lentimicrobium sp.]